MLILSPEVFEIPKGSPRNSWLLIVLFLGTAFLAIVLHSAIAMKSLPQLLTDPFLQMPTETSVRVVWFTEFPGSQHTVAYGSELEQMTGATTIKLGRSSEDSKSRVAQQSEDGTVFDKPIARDIWRHEAEIINLLPGTRVPYRVTSIRKDGQSASSDVFTLAPSPKPGTPLKILLTSDHQLMPMTSANLQKVVETVGRVDAVFHAGDLVSHPDRASEWFDDNRGNAFFPCLQGRANYKLERNGLTTTYKGGALIQYAPLFPTIGNHEVMGRFSREKDINYQFSDPFPRRVAEQLYQENNKTINPDKSPVFRDTWLQDNSFNTQTYEEIFTVPRSSPGGKKYYAVTFGDTRLVVLYITNIWRSPNLGAKIRGRYQERVMDFNKPVNWGYGQHIFEPIAKGSEQYRWLEQELASPEFQQAKYKIVMFHHPPHSLGGNIVPAYTDPVQRFDKDDIGRLIVRYEYPKDRDYIIRDVEPLLEKAKVQLVFFGHSHLWNRFKSPSGINFLESSNVGNSYGAHTEENKRPVPENYQEEYAAVGDPNGLEPIVPAIAPLLAKNGEPLPYIASNDTEKKGPEAIAKRRRATSRDDARQFAVMETHPHKYNKPKFKIASR